MKQIPVLLVLGFALSLCNLTNRLKTSTNSNEPGKTASMSWTVPPQWKQVTNESKELVWSSPGGSEGANLIVGISPMDESFPADISIKAFYDQAKSRAKNGEVDEVKWLEIDGLKGVEFREANPEKPDGFRRLQWMAYRKYAGQLQLVNLMLSSNGKGFPKHQDAMYGIMYSTKIVH